MTIGEKLEWRWKFIGTSKLRWSVPFWLLFFKWTKRLILASIYTKVSWSGYQMSFHSTRFGHLILYFKMIKGSNVYIRVSSTFKEQAKTSLLAALIAISLWSSVSKSLIIAVIHLLWSRCQFLIEALTRVLHAVKWKSALQIDSLHWTDAFNCTLSAVFDVGKQKTFLFVFWCCCHQLWQCLLWNVTTDPFRVLFLFTLWKLK